VWEWKNNGLEDIQTTLLDGLGHAMKHWQMPKSSLMSVILGL